MKQISVTAVVSLACCLLAVSLVSFDIYQKVAARQAGATGPSEFSAQNRQDRPQIYVRPPAAYPYPRPDNYAWPGPGAVRHCVDWYATEYRPSGTVITPQMRCRWVRRY